MVTLDGDERERMLSRFVHLFHASSPRVGALLEGRAGLCQSLPWHSFYMYIFTDVCQIKAAGKMTMALVTTD